MPRSEPGLLVMCFYMVGAQRIELATRTWKDRVIPFYERRVYINYTANHSACLYCLAGGIGIEPMHGGIKTRCLTAWRTPNITW